MRRVIKLGVTGGIAAGKSKAVGYLKDLGAQIINTDELAHVAYLPGTTTFTAIVKEFGAHIVAQDGKINRAVLGAAVFGKPEAMKKLSSIVWPVVNSMIAGEMEKMTQIIQKNSSVPPIIVVEAAVIVEAGWQKLFDKLWVFTVPPEEAIRRLQTRNNLTREEAQQRIASQLTNEERTKYADRVFDTNRDASEVKKEVIAEWYQLLLLSRL